MPDHYREILQHAPLAAIGMVIGQADFLYERIPVIFKVVTVVFAMTMGYADIKGDIRIIQTDLMHAAKERAGLETYMFRSDKCTATDCGEIKQRVRALEALRMEGK